MPEDNFKKKKNYGPNIHFYVMEAKPRTSSTSMAGVANHQEKSLHNSKESACLQAFFQVLADTKSERTHIRV